MTSTIAVDVMGGDIGPSCTIPACIEFLRHCPNANVLLVGDESIIASFLPHSFDERIQIIHASEVVTMDDSVATALRGKPDSSMKVALELVREGKATACVSAGNTGALMALSRYILKTISGIDRPAMMCALPTQTDKACYLLDLGANVDCTAEQLFQFAIMGAVAAEVLGVNNPKVALLNIGNEDIKGNTQVKQAMHLLTAQKKLDYIGFIEGDGVYRGDADVVVCDGFVGNVFLKASEGVLRLLNNRLEKRFKLTWLTKFKRLMMFLPVLKGLRDELSPEHYNGASFLGLQGIVIKSNGAANIEAFKNALWRAHTEINENLQTRLTNLISLLLVEK